MKKPIVVTTEYRGVFFGYISEETKSLPAEIVLENARMCVYWDVKTKGVIGLAAKGPTKDCRITDSIPKLTAYKVTAILECSPEAQKNWEKSIWS